MAPPVIILGVGRSGTTLLRVMLDRSSEIAIPYESFFVTPLAHRHGRRPNLDDFLDDLGRFYQLYEWGISPDDVRPKFREGMTTGEAIAAVFEVYAGHEGKPRWGDKTPLYMQHLPTLERLFSDALWVHLVRDGRDAAHEADDWPQLPPRRLAHCVIGMFDLRQHVFGVVDDALALEHERVCTRDHRRRFFFDSIHGGTRLVRESNDHERRAGHGEQTDDVGNRDDRQPEVCRTEIYRHARSPDLRERSAPPRCRAGAGRDARPLHVQIGLRP